MKLEELQQEVFSLSKKIEDAIRAKAITPTYKKGMWYKSDMGNLVNFQAENEGINYGFGYLTLDVWANNLGFTSERVYTPASEEEIKTALVKEATKRGFKEGVQVNRPEDWVCYNSASGSPISMTKRMLGNGEFEYCAITDSLAHSYVVIYQKGVWAEIIKDETVSIGSYKAEYKGEVVKFGCKSFFRSDVGLMLEYMMKLEIDAVSIEGHNVAQQDLKNILKGFK